MKRTDRAFEELAKARREQYDYDVESFRRMRELRTAVELALATWRVECERAGIRFDKNGKMVKKARKR